MPGAAMQFGDGYTWFCLVSIDVHILTWTAIVRGVIGIFVH